MQCHVMLSIYDRYKSIRAYACCSHRDSCMKKVPEDRSADARNASSSSVTDEETLLQACGPQSEAILLHLITLVSIMHYPCTCAAQLYEEWECSCHPTEA